MAVASRDGFGKPADGFDNVPFDNMNVLRDAITSETAAILVEPIQGEGGINPASIEYLKALRETSDEYGPFSAGLFARR